MAKNSFQLEIQNCRNIKTIEGTKLAIAKNALNVFYGKNGVGKSGLIKALKFAQSPTDENLAALESFEYRETHDPAVEPGVHVDPRIRHLLVFDDDWIDAFCFRRSGIHENAYELYVRNEDIKKLEKQRLNIFGYLRKAIASSEAKDVEEMLSEISKKIGKVNKSGSFGSSAPIVKAYKDGVPIEPVPLALKPAVKGMTAVEKANWLTWRQAKPIVHDADVCPYCGIEDSYRQDVCRQYDESRQHDGIKQWQNIAGLYSDGRKYLSRKYAVLLGKIIKGTKKPDATQIADLSDMATMAKNVIDALARIEKLLEEQDSLDAKTLVSDLKNQAATIESCDLFLKTHEGKKTNAAKAFDWITDAINRIASTQADIDIISKELIKKVADSVSGHEGEINAFLEQCGYPYHISIQCNIPIAEADVFLIPRGVSISVDEPEEALSYGEKNALALVLFMHEAIKQPSALIVLDDPISSFDYDKRYGILYALFSSQCHIFTENLAGKTVLVTTHDPLVVCDLIKIRVPGIGSKTIKGQYLTCDSDGVLRSTLLSEESMEPFTQLLRRKIKQAKDRPRAFGYVRIRQLAELLRRGPEDKRTKQGWTFSLVSDLIHGRDYTETLRYHDWDKPDDVKVSMCENYIKELTGWEVSFWDEIQFYADCMTHLIDLYKTPRLNSEDKLLLVRLMLERDQTLTEGYDMLKRFADESCHVGGSYLFQLNGEEFDQVPFYVVEWCNEVAKRAEDKYCNKSSVKRT